MELKRLYQNKPILNINIQHTGCYYVDLANIYQNIAGHQLEYETLNAVYVMCIRTKNFNGFPYMEKDCTVIDIPGISQIFSGLTKVPVYMERVKSYEKYTNIIGIFRRTTHGGIVVEHFVELALDSDRVIGDPWYPKSKTATTGKLIGKRFINARRL